MTAFYFLGGNSKFQSYLLLVLVKRASEELVYVGVYMGVCVCVHVHLQLHELRMHERTLCVIRRGGRGGGGTTTGRGSVLQGQHWPGAQAAIVYVRTA